LALSPASRPRPGGGADASGNVVGQGAAVYTLWSSTSPNSRSPCCSLIRWRLSHLCLVVPRTTLLQATPSLPAVCDPAVRKGERKAEGGERRAQQEALMPVRYGASRGPPLSAPGPWRRAAAPRPRTAGSELESRPAAAIGLYVLAVTVLSRTRGRPSPTSPCPRERRSGRHSCRADRAVEG